MIVRTRRSPSPRHRSTPLPSRRQSSSGSEGLRATHPRLPGLPPRHDPFVLALRTGGDGGDNPTSEGDACGAHRAHAVVTADVGPRAAGRVRVVACAVHYGEPVGTLGTHLEGVLRHRDPLPRDFEYSARHAARHYGIPGSLTERCRGVVALGRKPHAGPAEGSIHGCTDRGFRPVVP